jgi:hypothetical protein
LKTKAIVCFFTTAPQLNSFTQWVNESVSQNLRQSSFLAGIKTCGPVSTAASRVSVANNPAFGGAVTKPLTAPFAANARLLVGDVAQPDNLR